MGDYDVKIPRPPPGPHRPVRQHDHTGTFASTYTVGTHQSKTNVVCETAYFIWGSLHEGSETPLIAVHGGPGMTHSYMLPFSHLHVDYKRPVIMYDQVGCGQSTRFKDRVGDESFWTVELFVQQLDHLVKHLRLEHFDLLGHSWGGFLTGSFVINEQPIGLRKLIICNSATDMALISLSAEKLISKMPTNIQHIFRRCQQAGKFEGQEEKGVELYFYAHHSCRLPQPYPKELLDAMQAITEDSTCSDTMIGTSMLLMNGTLSKLPGLGNRLKHITKKTCPGGILVVAGKYDVITTDLCCEWWTEPTCDVRHMQLELSSHFTMFEEMHRLIEEIGSFLTG